MIKLLKEYVQPLSLLLPPPPAQYAPRYPEAEQICERVTSENKVINHTYAGVRVYMKFAGINVIDNDIIDRTRFTGEVCCCYCFYLLVDYTRTFSCSLENWLLWIQMHWSHSCNVFFLVIWLLKRKQCAISTQWI